MAIASSADAQSSDPARSSLRIIVGGDQVNWPDVPTFPADSSQAAGRWVIDRLRSDGHLFATLDSTRVGTFVEVFATAGPQLRVEEIAFTGSPVVSEDEMRRLMDTRAGDPFRQERLEQDLIAILQAHNRAGRPLAEASLEEMNLLLGSETGMRVVIRVESGSELLVHRLELPGARRTRPGYVARIVGIRPRRALSAFDPDRIRRSLEATNLFRSVGEPVLQLLPDSGAVILIPLEEEPPGNFDLVLGYTPETSTVRSGGLVGNGHLELRNLFGGGREFALRLNRLPGRVSSVDVVIADPSIFGMPFGIEGSFHGTQQDSTYDRQQYGAAFTYVLGTGFRIVVGATREVTKPGQAGLRLRGGRQRIARATASFFGIGARFESVDWPVNPSSGLQVETMFERGNKNRTMRRVVESDTLTERTRLNQERLRLGARYYVPTFARQVLVLGVDARLLLSDEYDESDLIRFGGANSLRGYNEQQFLGRLGGRFIVEYRYRIDRYAYAFLFTDIGLVETPETFELTARRDLLPGFGIGMQFRTRIGLINASYAFNDEDSPIDGRVHVGLSFTL